MKAVVIYAHPWEESYNHAVLNHVVEGLAKSRCSVDIIDLYKDKFNPVLPLEDLALYSRGESRDPVISRYQEMISSADYLYFIFPVWWYDLPAILKGFLDRVLLKHWAYDITPSGLPKGRLTFIKKATVISTMKSPAWYYRLLYGSSLKQSFIKGTLKFCGIKRVKWINICNIEGMSAQKRKHRLDNLLEYAASAA
jgi:NAD(P)H dehydrogenase (quinone)